METADSEPPVMFKILRSGVKLLHQPGKTVTSSSTSSYPPSQVKSKGKKFNNIPPLGLSAIWKFDPYFRSNLGLVS